MAKFTHLTVTERSRFIAHFKEEEDEEEEEKKIENKEGGNRIREKNI
jgi:hypothetical protein